MGGGASWYTADLYVCLPVGFVAVFKVKLNSIPVDNNISKTVSCLSTAAHSIKNDPQAASKDKGSVDNC